MVEPPRFTRALRDWAGDGPRRAYADEVAELYRRYREGLERRRAGGRRAVRLAGARRAARASRSGGAARRCSSTASTTSRRSSCDALRGAGATAPGADVVVSLPFEPGREAFRATRAVHERARRAGGRGDAPRRRLRPLRGRLARAPCTRSSAACSSPARRDVPPGRGRAAARGRRRARRAGAVRRGGAARCCARARRRATWRWCSATRRATRRSSSRSSAPTASRTRSTAPCRSPTPGWAAGLLALLRCARARTARADDLLAYLRTPGLSARARAGRPAGGRRAPRGRARRRGARASCGRTRRWPLDELDRARRAPARRRAAGRARARAWSGCSAARTGARRTCCRARSSTTRAPSAPPDAALAELQRRGRGRPASSTSTPQRVHDRWPSCRCGSARTRSPTACRWRRPLRGSRAPLRGGVRVRPPGARVPAPGGARGVPARRRPRASWPAASGLRLPLREDQLERERYLFYVCASRAERLLVLSSRYCDEEGNPEPPSFFVDDARAVFAGDLERAAAQRSLADVTWTLDDAPTEAEWERAVAHAGPRRGAAPGRPGERARRAGGARRARGRVGRRARALTPAAR